MKQALKSDNIKIVSLDWLNKAFSAKTKPSEKSYLMDSSPSKDDSKPPAGKKRGRAAKPDADDAEEIDDEDEEKPAPKKRGRSAAATKVKSEEPEEDAKPKKKGRVAVKVKAEEPEDDEEEDKKKKKPAKKAGRTAKVKAEPKEEEEDEEEKEEGEVEGKVFKDGQKASSKNLNVPVDEGCNLGGVWRVHIDDEGTM